MKLDTKKPVGNGVHAPQGHTGTTNIIPSATYQKYNAPEPTYNQANLSAKFKNPRVKQDVPEAARNQYM